MNRVEKELQKIKKLKLDKLTDKEKYQLYLDKDYDGLVKAHMLIFWKTACKFAYDDKDLAEEYLAVILEGVAYSINKFKPDTSNSISAYICNSGRNKLLAHLRDTKIKHIDTSQLDDKYDNVMDDDKPIGEENEDELNNIKLNKMIASLKPDDRLIMEHMKKGMTQAETARALNTSQQNLSLKVQRIMNKLRKNYKYE